MTHSALTAEQRAAIKTRADRVYALIAEIEKLDRWKSMKRMRIELSGTEPAVEVVYSDLANRAWSLGIDTLIAQLEQELSDLDKPQSVMTGQWSPAVKRGGTEELAAQLPARWSLEDEAVAGIEPLPDKQQGIERFPAKYIYADGTPLQGALGDATRCYEPRLSEAIH
jgi:hypothetical protein